MNNEQRIDAFLKHWAKAGIQNPTYRYDDIYTYNTIYHDLIKMGVKEQDKHIFLAEKNGDPWNDPIAKREFDHSAFARWIEYYQGSNQIDVVRLKDRPYFCLFVSKDYVANNAKEHLKIYVPLDAAHIEQGAKMIFNFLTENNISHKSKIGKEIRFDDIVIRLAYEDDAAKLLNFISSNSYIQEGLIKPNPFAHQECGVAMTCDGSVSYNYTIACLISVYLSECKKRNMLDKVSYTDFFNFIEYTYQKEFVTNESHLLSYKMMYPEKEKENYKQIISLLIKAQKPNFYFQDYLNHYHDSLIEKNQTEEDKILLRAIREMDKKKGEGNGFHYVKAYLATNNANYLTRDNNLRDFVVKSNIREAIIQRVRENRISLEEYVKNIDPSIIISNKNKQV